MKKIILFKIGICIVFSSNIFSQSTTYLDVDYVGDGSIKHKMDIYVPAGLTGPAPLVVYIHGGGWSAGSKGSASLGWIGDTLLANGYIFADINYRLSGDSIFPAQIRDCKTAIRFLKANASTYSIDSCKVGVMGPSAGGHLTSLLALSDGNAYFEGKYLGNPNVSSKVRAAITISTVSDFAQEQAAFPGGGCFRDINSASSSESLLLGCAVSTCTSTVQLANPITYIDPSDPPFYIAHGDADCTVPFNQSQLLYNGLIASSVPATILIEPGKVHMDAYFKSPSQKNLERLFFDTNVKYNNTVPSINISLVGGSNPSCEGDTLEFSAGFANGGSSPVFQWQVDGVNAGTNSPTFSSASLTNGQTVSCSLTSNQYCANISTVSSTGITVVVNPTPATPVISQSGGTLFSTASYGNQWYLNGILLAGDTLQSLLITANGNYSVITTQNGCSSDESLIFPVISVGTCTLKTESDFLFLVKNSQDNYELNYFTSHDSSFDLKVYKITGELIYSNKHYTSLGRFEFTLPSDFFSKGSYLFVINKNDIARSLKAIIY